ncbi:MAG: hypothetical protein ACRDTE_21485, partial [Pseudonocardiaceae bacterium]
MKLARSSGSQQAPGVVGTFCGAGINQYISSSAVTEPERAESRNKGLPAPTQWRPFQGRHLANGVAPDYDGTDGAIPSQHRQTDLCSELWRRARAGGRRGMAGYRVQAGHHDLAVLWVGHHRIVPVPVNEFAVGVDL